jgi:hypothetical protein
MQKLLNHFLNRKLSTQRIENMPSNIAVSALDKRVNQMLAMRATQPLPQPKPLPVLSNPIQMSANS